MSKYSEMLRVFKSVNKSVYSKQINFVSFRSYSARAIAVSRFLNLATKHNLGDLVGRAMMSSFVMVHELGVITKIKPDSWSPIFLLEYS